MRCLLVMRGRETYSSIYTGCFLHSKMVGTHEVQSLEQQIIVGATPYVFNLHHIPHRAGIQQALNTTKNSTCVSKQNLIQFIFNVY